MQLSLPMGEEHDAGCRVLLRVPADTRVSAVYDRPGDCYRYTLEQVWADGPAVLFGMMNPSGASERWNDHTIAKTGRIARRLGFGGQLIANACAYRVTDRMRLLEHDDPLGPGNLSHVVEMASRAGLVIIAHGRLPGGLQRHADAMVVALRADGHALHCLRLTLDGIPMHPLARGRARIPEDIEPVPWPSITGSG